MERVGASSYLYMKKPRLAFVYNIRHYYPDPSDPQSQREADFDDEETIAGITQYLEHIADRVIGIEADEDAYVKLMAHRGDIDLVFNYAMGLNGSSRYCHIPAMLEMLRIPYTGSSPLTQALIMHKAKMQEVLHGNGLPALRSVVITAESDLAGREFAFPCMVKPIAQGSSAGITNKSIAGSAEELREQVRVILRTFREPALVQPFLDGREFSVPMLGPGPRILPFIEPDFSQLPDGYAPIDSLEAKWIFEETSATHHLACPAQAPKGLRDTITGLCMSVWNVFDIKDWCRIDFRCDREGNPYVLDINSPPGIIPPEISRTSYLPLSARAAGMDYGTVLAAVIQSAIDRYGLPCAV